jgi:hypothetical protein
MNKLKQHNLYIFDFDDTLVRTTAKIYVHRGDQTFGLNPKEYKSFKTNKGDVLDFHEFDDVKDGTPIASTMKAMEFAISTEGVENVHIVTARAYAEPVRRFLGAKIPAVPEVHAVSGAENKASWLVNKLSRKVYTNVIVYEDSRENLDMFQAIIDVYNKQHNANVKFVEHHINEAAANRKNLMLDKPTMHGGWPNGEYEKPVNDQIMDWFKSMGFAETDFEDKVYGD